MNSILNMVDNYIKENNIPFKDITISYSYLPSYLNQAILNKIREIKGNNYDFGSTEYTFSYDENDNLYLIVHDSENMVNLIIANTKLDLVDYKITVISEYKLIEEAIALKDLDEYRLVIRNMINNEYKTLSPIEKIKLENNIINSLAKNKINNSSIDISTYNEELTNSANKINNYMSYLKDYYDKDMKEYSDKEEVGIYFSEPDSDYLGRKNEKNKYPKEYERVNEIIPFTARYHVLEKYPYIYSDYAYSDNYKEIEYMNYLYKLNETKYLLVMEPYNGIKFTRIAVINHEGEFTKEEFNNLVRHYLELSYIETIKDNSVVRPYHTTIETYEKVLDYAINGANPSKVNPYIKKKIKGVKEQ